MPTAIRETALLAFYARLQTLTAAGVTVARSPDFAFKAAELPAVAQFTGGHKVIEGNSQGDTREVQVYVYCGVKAATPDLLEPAINDLHARVVAAVMGDKQLGGLLDGYVRETEMTDPDFERESGQGGKAAVPVSRFALVFAFQLMTSPDSPYSQTLS